MAGAYKAFAFTANATIPIGRAKGGRTEDVSYTLVIPAAANMGGGNVTLQIKVADDVWVPVPDFIAIDETATATVPFMKSFSFPADGYRLVLAGATSPSFTAYFG